MSGTRPHGRFFIDGASAAAAAGAEAGGRSNGNEDKEEVEEEEKEHERMGEKKKKEDCNVALCFPKRLYAQFDPLFVLSLPPSPLASSRRQKRARRVSRRKLTNSGQARGNAWIEMQ